MRKFFLTLSCLSAIAFVSCEKKGKENEKPKVYLPAKIVSNFDGEDVTFTYTYDNANKLIGAKGVSKTPVSPNGIIGEYTLVYSGDMLIEMVEKYTNGTTQQTTKYTFVKQNNTIHVKENNSDAFSFTINNKNQIVNIGEETFFYDNNDNTIKVDSESNTTVFSYDNKNNIFKNVAIQPWCISIIEAFPIPYAKNNVIRMHRTDKEDNSTETLNYQVNYNSENYPIKYIGDNHSQTIEIDYIVK